MSDAPEAPQDGGQLQKVTAGKDRKMLRRQDLVAAVGAKTGLPKAKANDAVEAVFAIISDSLKSGHEIRMVGFGSFTVTERKGGKGRDPRTGQEIDIPSSKSVRFRPGKTLRGSVAGNAPPEA